MANYAWRQAIARCPYYHKSWDLGITCGERGNNLRRRFKTEGGCSEHFNQYCAKNYRSCPIRELVEQILE